MRTVFTLIFAFCVSAFSIAQNHQNVKIHGSVNSGQNMGNQKLLKSAPKEIYINQFCVWYKTANQDEAELIRWRMELGLTEELALEITNEAYQYFKGKLEAAGYTVKAYDKAAIEESRTYKKLKKKDPGAGVTNGSSYKNRGSNPNDYRIGTWAEGINTTYLGSAAQAGSYAMLSHELGGKDGKLSISITNVIDFMEWDISGKESLGYVESKMKAVPKLILRQEPLFGPCYYAFHNSSKLGSKVYGGYKYEYTNNDWAGEIVKVDEDVSTWQLNEAEFKTACLNMLKTYVDELVVRIQE